jgi:hypothetical protein
MEVNLTYSCQEFLAGAVECQDYHQDQLKGRDYIAKMVQGSKEIFQNSKAPNVVSKPWQCLPCIEISEAENTKHSTHTSS